MHLTLGRIISVPIAVVLLISGSSTVPALWTHRSAAEMAFRNCVFVIFALALIWFPEQIGAAAGYVVRGGLPEKTPGMLVFIAGWFFLIVPPVLMYLVSR